jgi:Tol biopolymer transport system component
VLAAAVLFAVGVLVLGAVTRPADAAFPGRNGDIANSKFSPSSDSSRIFTKNPDGSEQTLLEPGSSSSYSPEGATEPVQVTSGPAYNHSPTFLDDDTVAFIRDSHRNGTDIFNKNIVVGGAAQNITNTPVMYEERLAATFDGTDARIAFTRYNRSSDVFIMNDEGSDVTNLTRTGRIDEYDPDWSPDAQKITFTRATFSRTRGERGDIFVTKADGTDTRAFEYEPAWQPTDGSVAATGTLQPQRITTYQYGGFVLTDEATGQLYALRAVWT